MSSRSILMSAPFSGAPSTPLTSPSNAAVCAKPAIAQNRIPKAGNTTLRYFMEPPNFGIAGIKFPVYYRAGGSARRRIRKRNVFGIATVTAPSEAVKNRGSQAEPPPPPRQILCHQDGSCVCSGSAGESVSQAEPPAPPRTDPVLPRQILCLQRLGRRKRIAGGTTCATKNRSCATKTDPVFAVARQAKAYRRRNRLRKASVAASEIPHFPEEEKRLGRTSKQCVGAGGIACQSSFRCSSTEGACLISTPT